MAKINRVTYKVFGESGDVNGFGQFGSLAAGNPVHTKDPVQIQALPAYSQGLATSTDNATVPPAMEDENSIKYLVSSMIAYLLQEGIPEWDAGTTYYQNGIVKYNGKLYKSLIDNNLNNTPDYNSIWTTIAESVLTAGAGIAIDRTNPAAPVISAQVTKTGLDSPLQTGVEYQLGNISSLTVTYPAGNFICYITFTASANFTPSIPATKWANGEAPGIESGNAYRMVFNRIGTGTVIGTCVAFS
ncbi:MAG: hypothetical protein LBQ83_03070 [Candidatus Margulisbacteria bacterium]|jgi:hypothetical protein|nr:hypothetical protein [Candidatus Margulisiibacteriota bacterium]